MEFLQPRTPLRAVVLAGLLAGALDITAALTLAYFRGAGPIPVLHFIASGVLGPTAFEGGAATASLGLALHFVIALGAAAVYWAASRWIRVLSTHPIPSGLLYGVAVYFFMNLVVLPLSAVPQRRFVPTLAMAAIHMLLVGLPIALVLRRAAPVRLT